ncbi:hypothetical protein [Halothiobacillus neapolitanus]|uniref:Uncharacterized protein n=1 Tax=Halothiobacillus neapolitanus (strain ATCC 23641 / DSM 15147 / CIP 104769 / NCIMB 8539 / c2) TaxID=555778 RepID=D0L197_HALNC|nr:hypothetical protein [Halothiobacillus neapolitanus]ACX96470.1 hypothetical protein Hneap_1644 [Halothiobacillus neapolitanus c2]TDN66787.1 hypothetical protein C8D83_1011126 [Halothiobacillus neapolitanus]
MKRISLVMVTAAAFLGIGAASADGQYWGGFTKSQTYGSSAINSVVTDIYDDHDNPQLIGQKMTVNINPTAGVGQPTAYYVGIGINNTMSGMYTSSGWKAYKSGLYEPAAIDAGGHETFTVFGGDMTICQSVARQVMLNEDGIGNVGSVQFYAGYGYITPENQATMEKLYSQHATTVPSDTMQLMYAQTQMMQSKAYQKIYSVDCSIGN